METGAVHDTVAEPLPGLALMATGAAGAVAGLVGAEGTEADEVPMALTATTEKL